ncbi:aspartate/glutamate racemase family protein [Cohnella soli]|uniref:Aspartate/glutamate racemase family protein n=1 Tax=Cohnella soli TaxID=425005 RepID=A0ABW0HQJ2_9BACL
MKKTKIGCLHAHPSNIAFIEQALAVRSGEIELRHYVDSELVNRLTGDPSFAEEHGRQGVTDQLKRIEADGADVIIVTCTNYAALLPRDRLPDDVPVVGIDGPFLKEVCRRKGRQLLLFTNPATVEGTMGRLNECAAAAGLQPNVEARLIPGTFELVMQGKKEEYEQALAAYIRALPDGETVLSVAQLSMVDVARAVSDERLARGASAIGNPLDPLVAYLEERIISDPI